MAEPQVGQFGWYTPIAGALSNAWDFWFGPSDSQRQVQLAVENDIAHGINPDGSFVAPQYQQNFGKLTGVDVTDTVAIKTWLAENEASAIKFYQDYNAKNLADLNKTGTGFALPSLPNFDSGTVVTVLLLLVVAFVLLKVVR